MFKRLLCCFVFAATALVFALPASAAFPEEVRQALRLCSADIQTALAASPLPKNIPIAILPVRGDDDAYVIGLIKNAATSAGLACVEGKEDPFWDELVKEIEFSERKDDILDPATLTKFGKLKAAKLLLYAVVRDTSAANGRGYAEIEVHVSSIETKQHLWGQMFARRFYNAPDVEGLLNLDPDIRKVITESFDRAVAGLKTAEKLKSIKSIAIVPLAGDLDHFVTGLAESMLSKTQYFPKQLDTTTLGETRAMLRDSPQTADAILFGAVRDLSRRKLNSYPDRVEYEIDAAAQLTIQDPKTGNILWSDMIETRSTDVKKISWWEMVQQYGPFVLARKWYVIVPLIALCGLVVLALFFKLMRRAR
jgi:hypothetical protein